MHSTVVSGLSMDITTSLRLGRTPIFQKSNPTLHSCNSLNAHPYAHPWQIKVLKHFQYI